MRWLRSRRCSPGRSRLTSPSLPPLPLHGGARWGEYVEVRDTDVYGHPVNLASRLTQEAAPGEILVSAAFAAAPGTAVDPPPSPAGAKQFKNIPEPVECLRP